MIGVQMLSKVSVSIYDKIGVKCSEELQNHLNINRQLNRKTTRLTK